MPKKNSSSVKLDAIKHDDKRANIPTEELRDFIADEELVPQTMLYPRDPSLDPQLVWRGKDEQDRAELSVPVVPIYIQEKVHPQALINELVSQTVPTKNNGEAQQLDLFDDFNGGPTDFDKKVEFYRHSQNWTNRLILGDSLLVMTSLAEKEGLKGRVQTIYIDPPYGIKFNSNWQVSTRKRDVKDGKAEDTTRQPEQVHAYRDTWKLGVHSYLAYLRDRLVVARELLTETGSIFVQIGDENVHLVRSLMDEVFGSENCCSVIAVAKASAQSSELIPGVVDFLLWYSRDKESVKYHELFSPKEPFENPTERYVCVETPKGEVIDLSVAQKMGKEPLPEGRVCRLWPTFSQTAGKSSVFPYEYNGTTFVAPLQYGWQTTAQGLDRLKWARRLHPIGKSLRWKVYHDEFPYKLINNIWLDLRPGGFGEQRVYVVQTNADVIARCILMTTDPGDLVLDPTCGSGTTAYVAEQWGRRWITCDTSRVALALSRTRLMAGKYSYYVLADSPEGAQKEAELSGKRSAETVTRNDIRKGFVYKRVMHISLKSIANNPDIVEGMSSEEVTAAIARHAETEILFDQPFEDKKRVRVSGPFTVESLSPQRVLSAADTDMDGSVSEREAQKHQDFAGMILENLKLAGVQNTHKKERLNFETLDVYPGRWIQGVGEYTDAEQKIRRVAISIGPEHGTVGPEQVKEAAKEAVQGLGFEMLIVCGFAFDPHVSEEAKRYGNLTVLPAKMNPDLAMGDDLLKKTGTGNLFMVFGEPDVVIRSVPNDLFVVEINGVDVYDPTTGEVRSNSTDDIACWFIDSDYNGESFFVRHAYFTGAQEPYDKLKRALRAEIDEGAWSALYSRISQPFRRPTSGRIAIKVINHFGDEVLKVFAV